MGAYSQYTQKFSVCQQDNCGTIVVTDTSTGYGSGLNEYPLANIDHVDITFQRYEADGTLDTPDVFTFSLTDITGGGVVTSQAQLVFSFSSLSNPIDTSDGHVEITVNIAEVATDHEIITSMFFYCTVQCCVNSMKPAMYDHYGCDTCDGKYIDMVMSMDALLTALASNAACGNYTEAYKVLDTLNSLCDYTNCNCSK